MIFGIEVEIDQPPMFQKRVHSQDCTSIPSQVFPASRRSQISPRILPIHINNEIPKFHINCWSLGRLLHEKFRQTFLLDLMDPIRIEPCSAGRDHNRSAVGEGFVELGFQALVGRLLMAVVVCFGEIGSLGADCLRGPGLETGVLDVGRRLFEADWVPADCDGVVD